jgi:predicted dinucleotide-binding enzyme
MKIGVLGAGNIGGTLGRRWADAGHEVLFGVRDPNSAKVQALLQQIGSNAKAGSPAEAAAFGDVVLLAVPNASAQDAIQQAGDLTGKVLIDATNRMDSATPMAAEVARWAKGARVVKAFNSSGFVNYADSRYGDHSADNFLCGDDPDAKAIVAGLSRDIGLEPVDAGPLANAALLESLAKLWVQLAYPLGRGPHITFKLLKR